MRFPQGGKLCIMLLACLAALALAGPLSAQAIDEDEVQTELERRGFDQFDRMQEALQRWGRIFIYIAAALLGIVAIKIIDPIGMYYGSHDRLLKRAVRGVDELLKRIQEETQSTGPESREETNQDGGLLAGMAEIAEFDEAEQVPAYVLTVNDLMLDNIRIALNRLRRFNEGHAERYKEYMFTVLRGIKMMTEDSAASGVPSSLAVDAQEYFQDERRYKAWKKLLGRLKGHGDHQEIIDGFLVFMRDLNEGRPLDKPASTASFDETSETAEERPHCDLPDVLDEDTLPKVQQAAVREARHLVAMIRRGTPADPTSCWQFELVRRQQQLHRRDEAQKILVVFLSVERKVLPQITKTRMLPCRTFDHVMHMLGVANTDELRQRIEGRLLNIQEIILLEKVFLQTFAKKASLEMVYGHDADAALMMDLHVPQLRRQSLVLLRRLHETEPQRLVRATNALNEEETPTHSEVRRLIEQYVCHQRKLPDASPSS